MTVGPDTPARTAVLRDVVVPASDLQQDWWHREQTFPNPDLVITRQIRVAAQLDRDALVRAAHLLYRRHEAARSHFEEREGVPHLVVRPPVEPPDPWFERLDESELQARMVRERYWRFDLREGPLLRVGAVELTEGCFVLVVTLHHLLADSSATSRLIDELSTAYAAFRRGDEPVLPEAPSFVDWVAAEEAWASSPGGEADALHWRSTLAGLEELRLPTDAPVGDDTEYEEATIGERTTPELRERLVALSGRRRTSLSVVLHAAALVTLSEVLDRQDVAIMAIFGRRSAAQADSLVGCVGNSVTLRVPSGGDLERTLADTRQAMFSARRHQRLFVTRAWQAAGLRPTFVDVLFIYDVPSSPITSFGGEAAERYMGGFGRPYVRQGVRLWENVKVRVSDDGRRLKCNIDYNGRVYQEDRIQDFLDAYCRTLHRLAALEDDAATGRG